MEKVEVSMEKSGCYDLSGKVAVLTGGAGALCSAMARALGDNGAKVAILDVAEEAAMKLATEMKSQDIECLAVRTNVLDIAELRKAAAKVMNAFGRVDILVNGAGGNKPEATTSRDLSFFDLPEDAVKWVFNLNFWGTFLACQVFGKEVASQQEGVIVNISSMNAFRPLTGVPAYSAAKAAVSNFTQWLATYMSLNYSTKIRVNAIAPGFFLTRQNRFLLIEEKEGNLTQRGQTIIAHTPMKRFGGPEELVGAVLWLVSPEASFVHGAVIPVDGGFSAFSGV